MQNLDLPIPQNVVSDIREYFNDGIILTHDEKNKENIALIKNLHLGKTDYYVVMYHDVGSLICHYSQRFSTLLGAMVVYKKLKYALDNNVLERMWRDMLHLSRKKSNDTN